MQNIGNNSVQNFFSWSGGWVPWMKVTAARGRVVDDIEAEFVADITEHPIRVGFRPEMSIPCSPEFP